MRAVMSTLNRRWSNRNGCHATHEQHASCVPMQLEELSITGEEHVNAWAVGLDAIPEQWTSLVSLRTLQLRGHTMLLVRIHVCLICIILFC